MNKEQLKREILDKVALGKKLELIERYNRIQRRLRTERIKSTKDSKPSTENKPLPYPLPKEGLALVMPRPEIPYKTVNTPPSKSNTVNTD